MRKEKKAPLTPTREREKRRGIHIEKAKTTEQLALKQPSQQSLVAI